MQEIVGRKRQRDTLRSWLVRDEKSNTTELGFIFGSGGIGKTWFVEGVLGEVKRELSRGLCCLRLQGQRSQRPFVQLIEELVESFECANDEQADFEETKRDIQLLRDFYKDFEQGLRDHAKDSPELSDLIKDVLANPAVLTLLVAAATAAVGAPVSISAATPILTKHGPKAVEGLVAIARTVAGATVQKRKGREARMAIELSRDPQRSLARSLVHDLDHVLVAPLSLRFWRDRTKSALVMILDDWESLASDISEFVAGPLLEQLGKANFHTTVLLVGRSDPAADPVWKRKHAAKTLGAINVGPLNDEESADYVRRKIVDQQVLDRIVKDTNGYPFLLDLVIDEELAESRGSVASLEQFFTRIAQWMTNDQQRWAESLAFLDEITVDTIARVLPGGRADEIHSWFVGEGSLRDLRSPTYSMVPAIRARIRELVRKRSPERFEHLSKAALNSPPKD